jgi:methionyl aminopeptidase
VSYANRIPVKTRREISSMRQAGSHVAEILLELRERAKPGVTTGELDAYAEREIERRGAMSSFKHYAPGDAPPYPAVICASVNEEIVHGIPGARELKDGDIIGIDFGVEIDGVHGDSAVTIPIGEISDEAATLLAVTSESLNEGIAQMTSGKRLSDIGAAVQAHAERGGYSIVRQFVGHGIGHQMHEPPQVPNYGKPGRGPRLLPGMVFAIEPMVNVGTERVRMLDDEWTAVTADGRLSAHFEHTVLITDDGPEVLTRVEGSH